MAWIGMKLCPNAFRTIPNVLPVARRRADVSTRRAIISGSHHLRNAVSDQQTGVGRSLDGHDGRRTAVGGADCDSGLAAIQFFPRGGGSSPPPKEENGWLR